VPSFSGRVRNRVARWHILKPKIPVWVNFGGSRNERCLSILLPFGLFYGHLVCFKVIWYILWLFGIVPPFWYVVPRKIWQHWFGTLTAVPICPLCHLLTVDRWRSDARGSTAANVPNLMSSIRRHQTGADIVQKTFFRYLPFGQKNIFGHFLKYYIPTLSHKQIWNNYRPKGTWQLWTTVLAPNKNHNILLFKSYIPPCSLAGLDLTTNSSTGWDDTTGQRRHGKKPIKLLWW
jgi:hypothetical protein